MQALVVAVNVPVDQVKLISTEAVQWPDGCLGIVRMGVMCMRGPVEASASSWKQMANSMNFTPIKMEHRSGN